MRKIFLIIFSIFIINACAKISVQAPKEPIKVDITMRLDIYQHIIKDIDEVNSIVYGDQTPQKNDESIIRFFIDNAFAKNNLSQEIEEAALRRKNRLTQLIPLQKSGIVGENRMGLLQIRDLSADSSIKKLVEDENQDRMIIYQAIAEKNGVSVEAIQELYVKNNQEKAPPGTPIEVLDATTGKYEWRIR